MAEDFKEYLKKIKFEDYLKKLKRKLKNKTVIIYGSGALFQYIQQNYDLSSINIIGISDMKFTPENEGEDFLGYKIVPRDKIIDYKPDYVLISIQNYINIIEDFVLNVFNGTKIKTYPLARIPLLELIKNIWGK